jgi:hypothetical protein
VRWSAMAVAAVVVMASGCGTEDAFKNPSADGGRAGFEHARVGETIWFGGPNLTLRRTATVTSAQLLDGGAFLTDVRFYRFSIARNGRTFSLLEDKFFRQYGFVADGPLVGSTLEPSDTGEWLAFSAQIAQPGTRTLRRIRIGYRLSNGDRGSQVLSAWWQLGTDA